MVCCCGAAGSWKNSGAGERFIIKAGSAEAKCEHGNLGVEVNGLRYNGFLFFGSLID